MVPMCANYYISDFKTITAIRMLFGFTMNAKRKSILKQ